MLKLVFIRHGKTKGNEERRYVGKSDESLSDLGRLEIENLNYNFNVDKVYCSPLKRALETAFILFKGEVIEIVDGLKEIDFGDFEGRNYQELCNDRKYQLWIDSNGLLDVPNGEKNKDFIKRINESLQYITDSHIEGSVAIVTHGGVIMRLVAMLANDFNIYDYQVSNGHGFIVSIDCGQVINIERV